MPNQEEQETPDSSPEEILVNKLIDDINYFQMEWTLSPAQVIGCLNIVLHAILTDLSILNGQEEPDDSEE